MHPNDRFAVLRYEDRVQPISDQGIAQWRAELREILIKIIIRYTNDIWYAPSRSALFFYVALQ